MARPTTTDIAIIGAGPQALTLVTHLLQKRKSWRQRLRVIDPSGTWMSQWHRQFAAQEIPELRSPAVHHPDPNPHSLRTFAEGRYGELHPPYDRPGTRLFQDFCQDVMGRWQLEDQVIPAQVVALNPPPNPGQPFRLWLQGRGDTSGELQARRVILATGGGQPQWPQWSQTVTTPYPKDRLVHSGDLSLPSLSSLKGERVLIVGSGLTSGHLAAGAIRRGATVIMMARRQFQEKIFDAEPGWLGPKYLKDFHQETDMTARWHQVHQARNGGSLTPMVMAQLRRWQRQGTLAFYEHCAITAIHWQGDHWQVQCDRPSPAEEMPAIHRIWLATGTQTDITTHPLLPPILERHPIEIIHGLPVLTPTLQWPGCPLFLMGPWAALRVGPVARNLFGAKLACDPLLSGLKTT